MIKKGDVRNQSFQDNYFLEQATSAAKSFSMQALGRRYLWKSFMSYSFYGLFQNFAVEKQHTTKKSLMINVWMDLAECRRDLAE
jgi:hypothetical protein